MTAMKISVAMLCNTDMPPFIVTRSGSGLDRPIRDHQGIARKKKK